MEYHDKNTILKPLVKWAGGKRQIINTLMDNFPSNFNNYHEPFVGAGSVFMEMHNRGLLNEKQVYISDIMFPLINLYKVIESTNYQLLIDEFTQSQHYLNDKETYQSLKNEFNLIKSEGITNCVRLASLFIYLNKTGFNGMYRENSKGQYNIPFGRQKKPTLIVPESVKSLHNFLSKESVNITCCSFEHAIEFVNSGDFVYFDPPYYNTFTSYDKTQFGEDKQKLLRDYVVMLTNKGCKVAVSNSNEQFIRNLYKDIPNVRFIDIPVKRCINSKSDARKIPYMELLITNY